MSIAVNNKIIQTDAEGYLINPQDWNEEVAEAMAFQQTQQDHVKLTDEHWGLITYVRDYFAENKVHPSMHKLVMTLGKNIGKHFHDHKAYEKYLYELFPHGPIPELCKLAGLSKPSSEFED